MKKLYLILTEASLETIPKEIQNHPIIIREALRKKVKPNELILDRARHHFVMKKLPYSWKRGRPDIVHMSLLSIQYSILNKYGYVKTYIHTIQNLIIDVKPETRIPKNYNNFIGLMQQLFKFGRVPPNAEPLLEILNVNLQSLIDNLNVSSVILLDDVRGLKISFIEFIQHILNLDYPCILIGAFPHGEFNQEVYKIANEIYRIGNEVYETWILISKLLTYLEHGLGLEK